jgi:cyclopropane fatty-acyl-phospholipid synthase-like methyltransferase
VDVLNPQAGERILDMGCGTGYLSNIIAAAGATVVGIDNSFHFRNGQWYAGYKKLRVIAIK